MYYAGDTTSTATGKGKLKGVCGRFVYGVFGTVASFYRFSPLIRSGLCALFCCDESRVSCPWMKKQARGYGASRRIFMFVSTRYDHVSSLQLERIYPVLSIYKMRRRE